ncbi:hypothetical protein BT69DRAFT_1275401 [Atractiella rhizophila]|nr:hypothetical protein BT69DRAFT_1275401 [Atractiella rhizophila]
MNVWRQDLGGHMSIMKSFYGGPPVTNAIRNSAGMDWRTGEAEERRRRQAEYMNQVKKPAFRVHVARAGVRSDGEEMIVDLHEQRPRVFEDQSTRSRKDGPTSRGERHVKVRADGNARANWEVGSTAIFGTEKGYKPQLRGQKAGGDAYKVPRNKGERALAAERESERARMRSIRGSPFAHPQHPSPPMAAKMPIHSPPGSYVHCPPPGHPLFVPPGFPVPYGHPSRASHSKRQRSLDGLEDDERVVIDMAVDEEEDQKPFSKRARVSNTQQDPIPIRDTPGPSARPSASHRMDVDEGRHPGHGPPPFIDGRRSSVVQHPHMPHFPLPIGPHDQVLYTREGPPVGTLPPGTQIPIPGHPVGGFIDPRFQEPRLAPKPTRGRGRGRGRGPRRGRGGGRETKEPRPEGSEEERIPTPPLPRPPTMQERDLLIRNEDNTLADNIVINPATEGEVDEDKSAAPHPPADPAQQMSSSVGSSVMRPRKRHQRQMSPGHINRPDNVWVVFLKHYRVARQEAKAMGLIKSQQITKEASKIWKKMTDEDRAPKLLLGSATMAPYSPHNRATYMPHYPRPQPPPHAVLPQHHSQLREPKFESNFEKEMFYLPREIVPPQQFSPPPVPDSPPSQTAPLHEDQVTSLALAPVRASPAAQQPSLRTEVQAQTQLSSPPPAPGRDPSSAASGIGGATMSAPALYPHPPSGYTVAINPSGGDTEGQRFCALLALSQNSLGRQSFFAPPTASRADDFSHSSKQKPTSPQQILPKAEVTSKPSAALDTKTAQPAQRQKRPYTRRQPGDPPRKRERLPTHPRPKAQVQNMSTIQLPGGSNNGPSAPPPTAFNSSSNDPGAEDNVVVEPAKMVEEKKKEKQKELDKPEDGDEKGARAPNEDKDELDEDATKVE